LPPERAFAAAYRDLYGYLPEARPIELVAIRVAASSRPPETPAAPEPENSFPAAPAGVRRACFAGRWGEVPFYEREALDPGAAFAGPCLVFEAHSATVVPQGWRGRIDGARALALDRVWAPAQFGPEDGRPEGCEGRVESRAAARRDAN
jgi:N-methylhydantoinase A/oxoprolinase/acetone carboxylase beta subunit